MHSRRKSLSVTCTRAEQRRRRRPPPERGVPAASGRAARELAPLDGRARRSVCWRGRACSRLTAWVR
eukprot:7277519-Prymnesium_polylepis.1